MAMTRHTGSGGRARGDHGVKQRRAKVSRLAGCGSTVAGYGIRATGYGWCYRQERVESEVRGMRGCGGAGGNGEGCR